MSQDMLDGWLTEITHGCRSYNRDGPLIVSRRSRWASSSLTGALDPLASWTSTPSQVTAVRGDKEGW